jgi:UDP:flavonoid glycosyltransferase YjiC (YdhE family)
VTFAAASEFDGRLPVRVTQSVPVGFTLDDAIAEARSEVRDPADPFAWPAALFGIVAPRHVRPRLLDLWAREGRPDLVVYDHLNVGAAQAAEEVGVPAVAFQTVLTPAEYYQQRLAPLVEITLDNPVIDPTPPSWRAPGLAVLERIPIRTVPWSDGPPVDVGARPAAYLTLGTVSLGAVDVLRRSVLETAQHCRTVVVAAGPGADVTALGPLADHVQVHPYVDQGQVLQQVDVAIHHGGSGTVLAALAAGVPQVITPQGADQFLNAERLTHLTLGRVVHNDATDGAVGQAVRALLDDPHVRARCQALEEEIASMPSPAAVVDTLVARYGS